MPDAVPAIPDPRLETLADAALAFAVQVQQTAARMKHFPLTEAAALLPPLAGAFARLGRCVRQSVALQHRVARDRAAATHHAHRLATRRASLIRQVEDTIHHRIREPDREDLLVDLRERLQDPLLDVDLLERNVDALAEELRRDYGIGACHPSVARPRTAADIRLMRRAAAPPAAPPDADLPTPDLPTTNLPTTDLPHPGGPRPPSMGATH